VQNKTVVDTDVLPFINLLAIHEYAMGPFLGWVTLTGILLNENSAVQIWRRVNFTEQLTFPDDLGTVFARVYDECHSEPNRFAQ
jgi:hypothetical protein